MNISAFTQNNVLQRIYSVGETFTVLADIFYGDAKYWYSHYVPWNICSELHYSHTKGLPHIATRKEQCVKDEYKIKYNFNFED